MYLNFFFSSHSNYLQYRTLNREMCDCLPEYGNSSEKEEDFIPVVGLHSPFGFMTALYRLVFSFAKIHKGLITKEEQVC